MSECLQKFLAHLGTWSINVVSEGLKLVFSVCFADLSLTSELQNLTGIAGGYAKKNYFSLNPNRAGLF